MKRLYAVLALLAIASLASAQTKSPKGGIALGADRDSLAYIIASPFDNWYLTVGAGVQTYIGSEIIASARKNKLNFNLHAEVGKWVIPDVAMWAKLGWSSVDAQTTMLGRHPFTDVSDPKNDNGYTPFHANVGYLMGGIVLDWTNFLLGYEQGKQKRLHVSTPVGLGVACMFGKQHHNGPIVDGNHEFVQGDFRRNFELAWNAGLALEWNASPNVALNVSAELMGARHSLDWSSANNDYSIFDLMPQVNVGLKFNLFKQVTKYNTYTKTSSREAVNHEFLTFGSRRQVAGLKGRIQALNARIDSVLTTSHEEIGRKDSLLARLTAEQALLLDSLRRADPTAADGVSIATNIFEELIIANRTLDLPFVIVYYKLNDATLDLPSRKKLQNFAKSVTDLGDTVEYYIIGAADAHTGTPRINMRLSTQRCAAVHSLLSDNLGISSNQLIDIPMGGLEGYIEENRMAMVIVRTPATQAIVDRWYRSTRHTEKVE